MHYCQIFLRFFSAFFSEVFKRGLNTIFTSTVLIFENTVFIFASAVLIFENTVFIFAARASSETPV